LRTSYTLPNSDQDWLEYSYSEFGLLSQNLALSVEEQFKANVSSDDSSPSSGAAAIWGDLIRLTVSSTRGTGMVDGEL